MSNLKLNENLFLGKQELNRLIEFLKDDGYLAYFKSNVEQYGLINLPEIDSPFRNLKIENGSTVSKISINAGTAITSDAEVIDVAYTADVADVPTDNVVRYVCIEYATTTIEKGTVDIAVNGQITGTGTAFTEVLRGQPNFPSRVRFPNSVSNTLEYNVITVTNDTSATLSGVFVVETTEEYIVVGTFTPDASIPPANKEIFVYDGYTLSVNTVIPPNSFTLATVQSNGAVLTVQDLRTQFFETKASFDLQDFQRATTPLIGLESVKYDTAYSRGGGNVLATMGWGFRSPSGGWTGSTTTNAINIVTGQGGAYTPWSATTQPPTGTMDGWRVYFGDQTTPTDQYAEVVSQVTGGGIVTLSLRQYTGTAPTGTEDIVVVPPASSITFNFAYFVDATEPNCRSEHTFPIQSGIGICRVKQPVTAPTVLNGTYKFNWNKWESKKSTHNSTFLTEASFDDKGVQTSTVTGTCTTGDFTIVPDPNNDYTTHASLIAPNLYSGTNSDGIAVIDASTELSVAGHLTLPTTGNSFNIINMSAGTPYSTVKSMDYFGNLSDNHGTIIRLYSTGSLVWQLERNATPSSGINFTWIDSQGQTEGGVVGGNNEVWTFGGQRYTVPANTLIIRTGMVVTCVQGYTGQPTWRVIDVGYPQIQQNLLATWNDARLTYGGTLPTGGAEINGYDNNAGTSPSTTAPTFTIVNNWAWKVMGDTMLVTFDFEFTDVDDQDAVVIGVKKLIPSGYKIQTNSSGFSMAGYGYCRMVMFTIGGSAVTYVVADNSVFCQVREATPSTDGIEFLFRQIGSDKAGTGGNPIGTNLPYSTVSANPYKYFPTTLPASPTLQNGIQISGTVMIPIYRTDWI